MVASPVVAVKWAGRSPTSVAAAKSSLDRVVKVVAPAPAEEGEAPAALEAANHVALHARLARRVQREVVQDQLVVQVQAHAVVAEHVEAVAGLVEEDAGAGPTYGEAVHWDAVGRAAAAPIVVGQPLAGARDRAA